MKALFSALENDPSLAEVIDKFNKKNGQTFVYGLNDSQKRAAVAAAFAKNARPLVIIVPEREALDEWREDLSEMLPGVPLLELPETDTASFSTAAKSMELSAKRMDVLGHLLRHETVIVLARAAAAVQKGISCQEFMRLSLPLKIGDVISRDELLSRLVQIGYEHTEEVECIGQFSARGGIVDVFPINSRQPLRIEFFDDEIESLREYELLSKRSCKNISSFNILPLMLTDETGTPELFLSYLGGAGTVIFDEPTRIREQIVRLVKENPEVKHTLFSWADLIVAAKENNAVYFALMLQRLHDTEPDTILSVIAKAAVPYQRQMHLLAGDLKEYLAAGQQILILMSDDTKAQSLREILVRHSIPAIYLPHPETLKKGTVTIAKGVIGNGFEIPAANLAVITERDIFGRQKKKLVKFSAPGQKIDHFRDIRVGDYVVHINHGIGKYLGVETLEIDGVHRDYLHIKYAGNDKLFVPTDQVQMLQKYIGTEGEVPHLNRMSGSVWAKAKARAKAAVEDIAKELLALYAKRSQATGCAFLPDTPWQQEFEEAFPFEETPDQLAAIEEIKRDMEKPEPMDRLLCGDVGFGKTEVAVRAAFKAVMSGKQVAVLVPTTVLAQQHYQTFLARFNNFGPQVDVICRFRTPKEQRLTVERTENGQVDILIGTHALLNSKKVKFKDLGLLIVDEEQRFGVKQKEKIKTLANGIDVLTLSATPIPRTLHMSLTGARDMSIIETPPAERHPIQTYVIEADDNILAGAIRRELKRGGQIYFIYNRVETIDYMRRRLEMLVPEARIQTAHGQMSEALLERVMVDFYEGAFDILLATSIVENGLDVANANTIIVYDADRFGLSQLYQMRGRVGRSSELAFAYFVYQPDKVLSETAEKRLQAMKDFAELGAGFKIAMRDLEIRGAGNLLGSQQHGHISSVGFEMYCRMLEETVQSLKTGKPVVEIPDPVIEVPVEAYIDGGYIDDAMHKIEIYQRIASVRKEKQLLSLTEELIDRFGKPTRPVQQLLNVARIKNYARDLGMRSVIVKAGLLELTFLPDPKFEADNLVKVIEKYGKAVKLLQYQSMLRFKVSEYYQQDILGFVMSIMKQLAGEEIKERQ